MVLLNKAALSSFGFRAPTALLLFQCTVAVAAAAACAAAGVSRIEPPSWRLVRTWAPVNVLFVGERERGVWGGTERGARARRPHTPPPPPFSPGMVWSSFFSLRDLGVPMVTVLKNLTNLLTIGGDWWLHGRTYGGPVWATLALMTASALCGAATDLAFSARGYAWQLVNCAFTAGYSLGLRGAMDRASTVTVNRRRLNELSMVFYNNLLSIPLIAPLTLANGELLSVWGDPALRDPRFVAAAAASAGLAFGISFASLWFLSTTTATTFSLVGSLNKVPVALVGLLAFGAPATPQNVASVGVGLAASAVFVLAKAGPTRGGAERAPRGVKAGR